MVSFIFTLVERRATQTLSYYPVADALLSFELPLKTMLLKMADSMHCLGSFQTFSTTLTLMQQPNSAQLLQCFCIWMRMKRHGH